MITLEQCTGVAHLGGKKSFLVLAGFRLSLMQKVAVERLLITRPELRGA
jgi:hypothetical protein